MGQWQEEEIKKELGTGSQIIKGFLVGGNSAVCQIANTLIRADGEGTGNDSLTGE